MISKVFVAYIIALGVVPSLTANPITPSDPAVDSTLAASSANTGAHSHAPPSTTAESGSATPSSQTPPATASSSNTTSTIKDPASSTDATSVAHSPTSASNQSNATPEATSTKSTAATHDPKSESPTHSASPPQAPNTNSAATPKAPTVNSTAPSGSNQENGHIKSMPVAKLGSDGQPALPLMPTCYNKKKSNGVETHHCEKALNKLVYGANQTLDKFSSLIFANYKTCNINVYKPKNATLSKFQVGSMVHNITEACHSVGGVLFKTSQIAIKVERSKAENTYEVDTPICKKEQCPLTLGDCLSAFYQIPLDRKGGLTSKNSTHSLTRVTSGNCTVTISTTDYSNLDISRHDVYPTIRKLFNGCDRHPGKIYLPGGSTGFNGDLKISTRASDPELCE